MYAPDRPRRAPWRAPRHRPEHRARVALLGALALALLAGCGAPPRPDKPPPPPSFDGLLPPDAPLTAVVRPARLRGALDRMPLPEALRLTPERVIELPGPGEWTVIDEALTGLGIDPERPVWIALRAGPVLGVLRAAEDTERVLADASADPVTDPRLASGAAAPAGPFERWLAAHPPPPAWTHLRLVGSPAPGPGGLRIDPAVWLARTQGALATTGPADPAETLAATLDIEPAPAGALQAALAAHAVTVYRLLDRPLPTAVLTHRRAGAHPALVVDVLWDQDLGAGALGAAMAALPEAGGVWSEGRALVFGAPAEDELLRLGLDHAGWLAAARMMAEVRALQAVLGQGPMPADAHQTLAAGRRAARTPSRLMGPIGPALTASALSVIEAPDGLRARLTVAARTAAFGALRDGTAPADHGLLADGLLSDGPLATGPALAATLAQPPEALRQILSPHIGPPDRPLPALLAEIEACGVPCLPALWTTPLAYARDLPGTIAGLTGHAPLESALAEATGIAAVWLGPHVAAAVGHRAPATLAQAAWGPIVDAAGLASRWLVSDRAVLIAGQGPPLALLTEAARSPAVTDAAVLRITAVDPAGARLRLEGALGFDRQGYTVDLIIDHPADGSPR